MPITKKIKPQTENPTAQSAVPGWNFFQTLAEHPWDATRIGAATAARVGSNWLSAPGGGFGAGIGAIGEGLAQNIENSNRLGEIPGAIKDVYRHLTSGNPEEIAATKSGFIKGSGQSTARIGMEAALGSIPVSAMYRGGRVIESGVRSAAAAGLGEAGREYANTGTINPKSVAATAGIGGIVGAGLGKFTSPMMEKNFPERYSAPRGDTGPAVQPLEVTSTSITGGNVLTSGKNHIMPVGKPGGYSPRYAIKDLPTSPIATPIAQTAQEIPNVVRGAENTRFYQPDIQKYSTREAYEAAKGISRPANRLPTSLEGLDNAAPSIAAEVPYTGAADPFTRANAVVEDSAGNVLRNLQTGSPSPIPALEQTVGQGGRVPYGVPASSGRMLKQQDKSDMAALKAFLDDQRRADIQNKLRGMEQGKTTGRVGQSYSDPTTGERIGVSTGFVEKAADDASPSMTDLIDETGNIIQQTRPTVKAAKSAEQAVIDTALTTKHLIGSKGWLFQQWLKKGKSIKEAEKLTQQNVVPGNIEEAANASITATKDVAPVATAVATEPPPDVQNIYDEVAKFFKGGQAAEKVSRGPSRPRTQLAFNKRVNAALRQIEEPSQATIQPAGAIIPEAPTSVPLPSKVAPRASYSGPGAGFAEPPLSAAGGPSSAEGITRGFSEPPVGPQPTITGAPLSEGLFQKAYPEGVPTKALPLAAEIEPTFNTAESPSFIDQLMSPVGEGVPAGSPKYYDSLLNAIGKRGEYGAIQKASKVDPSYKELARFMGREVSETGKKMNRFGVPEVPPTAPALNPKTIPDTPTASWITEQLNAIANMGGSEKGITNPELLLAATMGGGGALVGAAKDPEHPFRGALTGAAIGAGGVIAATQIPKIINTLGAPSEYVASLSERLARPEGLKKTAAEIKDFIPQYQRFALLADSIGLPTNAVLAPYGAGITAGIEHVLKGDPRGLVLLRINTPQTFAKAFIDAKEEAMDRIMRGEMGRAEGLAFDFGKAGGIKEKMAIPGLLMTQGDVAMGRILEKAGFNADEIRNVTLTNEAHGKLFRDTSNWAKGTFWGNLALPFRRTPASAAEQGIERTPIAGLFSGFNPNRTLRDAAVEQGLGLGAGYVGYEAGKNLDPESAKYARRTMVNSSARYGLPVGLGFAMGQMVQKGKPALTGINTRSISDALPLPSMDIPLDWWNYITGNKSTLPNGVIPGVVRSAGELTGIIPEEAPSTSLTKFKPVRIRRKR